VGVKENFYDRIVDASRRSTISVRSCPMCGLPHQDLDWMISANPPDPSATHWYACPVFGRAVYPIREERAAAVKEDDPR